MDDLPRQKLRELIAAQGQSLCDEARRCEGFLRDVCGSHKREINLIVSALKARVPAELLGSQTGAPPEVVFARLARRLEDDMGLSSEGARWAVDTWAFALGLAMAASPPKEKPRRPTTRPERKTDFVKPPPPGENRKSQTSERIDDASRKNTAPAQRQITPVPAIFDPNKALLHKLTGHGGGVNSVAFSPDDRLLASASNDKTIKLWDVASGREIRTLVGHRRVGLALLGPVWSVAFTPDGRRLVSGAADKTIKLWEVDSGQAIRTYTGHRGIIFRIALSSNGTEVISTGFDGTIRSWNLASGESVALKMQSMMQGGIRTMALAPRSMMVAFAAEQEVKLLDLQSGNVAATQTLTGHKSPIWSLAFSPDESVLASGDLNDSAIKLWNVHTRAEIRTLHGHTQGMARGGIMSLAFSRDGRRLASGGRDRTVKLWDIASGREVCTLAGHESLVGSVAFAADGRTLASASHDRSVRLWDVGGT